MSAPSHRRARGGPRGAIVTERIRAAVVATVAVIAVLVPLGRGLFEDSFPLSNYPMFTHDPPAVTSFLRAIGVTTDGTEHVLGPEAVGGTVEVIHAAQTIANAVRRGQAAELCAEIAARSTGEVVEVLVVTERYDVIDGLRADHPVAVDREIHASCEVER